ncbi:hypothetical protein R83H12_01214 [Fibrobacteria bacterium R8-3-H12]
MKTRKYPLALLLLAAISMFILSCGHHTDTYEFDGVNWDGDSGGTLELVNGSNKDMVLFVGQSPAASSMIGGVRAGATRKYDISKHVDDFAVGGYTVLRGVSKEIYDKNIDLTKAKIEFTAMVTYRSGALYRYNIDKNFIGDYVFRVQNNERVGIELRKDSPDGEKVAYLPAFQRNQMVYASSTDIMTLFPVFVIYNNNTKEITTIKSASMAASASVAAVPPTDKEIPTIDFPDEGLSWDEIVGDLRSPVAYIKFTNNVMNQACYFTNAGSIRYISQDGFDGVNSGKTLTFEVKGEDPNEDGEVGVTAQRNLVVVVRGSVKIPVLKEGETTPPLIENGYEYTASVKFNGGDVMDALNYEARIVKGNKRKIEIGSI